MRTMAIVSVALALLACGGGTAGSTPEETFGVFRDAFGSQDYGTLYELMQPSKRDETARSWEKGDETGRKLHEEYAKKLGRSIEELEGRPFKEVWIEVFGKMIASVKERDPDEFKTRMDAMPGAEIVEVEYNDDRDRATVKYKTENWSDSVRLYLEDGLWYLRFERR